MRIKITYHVTISEHEFNELVRLAREHGYDWDPKTTERQLVKTLLQSDGTGILASTEPEKITA